MFASSVAVLSQSIKMVHHHRKQDSGDQLHDLLPFVNNSDHHYLVKYKKATPTLLRLFLLFTIFSFAFASVSLVLFPSSLVEDQQPHENEPPCSSVADNSICCDRTAARTDVCFMRGDVRTDFASSSIVVVSPSNITTNEEEKIRPYTRKWEKNTMATIDELRLRHANESTGPCDVRHDVPAVFFSTGGYTGNVYHEFNDGIIPLYITAHQFNKKVVFVILEYHDWWISKYENILSQLSDFAPIDFANDKRTHCFPEAIVGLKIHDELAIDSAKMTNNRTIRDFRRLLDESYRPRIKSILAEEGGQAAVKQATPERPKLVIVSRNGSRGIENEGELAKLAERIGFQVETLRPVRTTELARIYLALNSCDAMVGVHGAAMTHFLFMRPGSVFVQIVPLGTDWAAEAYYGEPAMKLGLKYVRYAIQPRESSLYREYNKDDPVLSDPESVNAKGWEFTKKVYLDGQNVRLDLGRFGKRLVKAHQYLVSKSKKKKSREGFVELRQQEERGKGGIHS